MAQGWWFLAVRTGLVPVKIGGMGHDRSKEHCAGPGSLEHGFTRSSTNSSSSARLRSSRSIHKAAYQTSLRNGNILLSKVCFGNCFDHAFAESFFRTLKAECATHQFPAHALARTTIFEYVEVWYNRRRMHSAFPDLSPVEINQQPGY
jgi:hypothetical protein